MNGTYNPSLVVLSLLVAILASYTALDLASRLDLIGNRSLGRWVMGGGFVMGFGIWSMHFIGMLAFNLPIAVGFDPAMTLVSLAVAILASCIGLLVLCRHDLHRPLLAVCASIMGCGVAGMHYLGMDAMDMCPPIRYSTGLVVLSVVIAILASGAALLIAFTLRRRSVLGRLRQMAASIVMGLAICGMHYSGMAAARFQAGSVSAAVHGMPAPLLAGLVTTLTLAILGIGVVAVLADARLAALVRAQTAENLRSRVAARGRTDRAG